MNDIIYLNLMQSIPPVIFDKHFRGFLKYKDDMVSEAQLQVWRSKNKFDSTKGKLESFMATICFNSFNKYIERNIYKHKDDLLSIDLVEFSNSDYGDSRNSKTDLINAVGTVDMHYSDIEYRELMERFDKRVVKENKENSGKKTNLEELHQVIDLLLEGYNQNEIGKIMDKDFRIINKKVKRIRDIFNRIL